MTKKAMEGSDEMAYKLSYEKIFRPQYDSPIELDFVKSIVPTITASLDSAVIKTVQQYAVGVDEVKLIQALTQDKERYQQAYSRGVLSAKKQGKWKLYDEADNIWMCDECGELHTITEGTPFDNGWLFCPHCGALLTEIEWGQKHIYDGE